MPLATPQQAQTPVGRQPQRSTTPTPPPTGGTSGGTFGPGINLNQYAPGVSTGPAPGLWNTIKDWAGRATTQATGMLNTGMQNYGQQFNTAVDAQGRLIDMQYGDANRQLGYDSIDARNGYNLDQRGLQNDAFYGQARLGEQQYRDVDLQRWIAQQQLNEASRARTTAQTGAQERYDTDRQRTLDVFGTSWDRMNTGYAADIGGLNSQDKFLGQQRDFIGQQFGIAQGRSQLQFDANSRQARDAAAAAGSATSTGYGDTRSELRAQLDLDGRGNRLGRDTDYAGNDRSRRDSAIDRTRTESMFGIDQRTLTNARDGDLRSSQNQRDQAFRQSEDSYFGANNDYKARTASLDSIGREYGLRGQEMQSALELGISRLNLNLSTTMNRITAQTDSNNRQALAAKNALVQQVLAAAGR